jgi:hypothetical protein
VAGHNVDVLRFLVKRCAVDVYRPLGYKKRHELSLAVEATSVPSVEYLLSHGANPESEYSEGKTTTYLAMYWGKK